jgi:hypothetical protein
MGAVQTWTNNTSAKLGTAGTTGGGVGGAQGGTFIDQWGNALSDKLGTTGASGGGLGGSNPSWSSGGGSGAGGAGGAGGGSGGVGYSNLLDAANATAAGNLAAAKAATLANRSNVAGPTGQSTWVQDPTTGQWTQSNSLSAPLQGMANTAQGNLASSINTPLSVGNLKSSAGDPNLLNQQVTDALYKQQTQYLDPQFQQSQAAMESQLANQGITRGSEAYNTAMNNAALQKQQAYGNARDSAIGQGVGAAQGMFGMNLQNAQLNNQSAQQGLQGNMAIQNQYGNQLQGLYGMGPQGTSYNQQSVAGADILGAANANNANSLASNNAALAAQTGNNQAAAGLVGSIIKAFSDKRLKTNIVKIGQYANGLTKYSWDYVWGESAEGVMADEVEAIISDAVSTHWTGFKMVNYSMLGA